MTNKSSSSPDSGDINKAVSEITGTKLKAVRNKPGVINFFKKHSLLFIYIFASVVVFSSVGISRTVVSYFVNISETSIQDKLCEASKRLAMLETAEELDAFREPADAEKPEWLALRQKLVEFAEEANVLYAYYLRVENNKVQYIADNDFDEEKRVGIDTEPEPLEDYPDITPALEGVVSVTPLGFYVTGWDGLISAYAPIFDKEGNVAALCGVDINDQEMISMRRKQRYLGYLELASVVIVFFSGMYGFIKYRREAKDATLANKAKTRFLSRISHEIRTPMNAVLGMSDLAAMNYGKPKGLEYIGQIKQAGNNLLAIINDILDLSAAESGKLSITEAPYSVSTLLNDVLSITYMKMKDKKGVELFIEVDPETPATVIGDETRVREVLMNILTNAVKYTPIGFIKLKVNTHRESNDSMMMIFEVYDSGIGIKPNDIDKIFVDFSRAESKYVHNTEGTGLGLAITRMICRAMGGDVKVESKYGAGSKFTAMLRQRSQADCAPIGKFEVTATVVLGVENLNFIAPDFHVLIVDDLETNLMVAEGLLASYLIKTKCCMSGQEAVELVQKSEYDLVLMDHMMPEMDGIETVAAIRALGGKYEKLPISALTANAVVGMKELFLEHGFNDYLSKPIEIPKLKDLLEKWIPVEKRVYADKRTILEHEASMEPERRQQVDRRVTPNRRIVADRRGSNETRRRSDVRAKSELLKSRIAGIEGLDVTTGIAATGGTVATYREVLKIYCRDVNTRIDFLNVSAAERDIVRFISHVHALKSASASIGAESLAVQAKALEDAGNRGDKDFIGGNIENFRKQLADMAESISAAINIGKSGVPDNNSNNREADNKSLDPAIISAFLKLKESLEKEDVGTTEVLLAELSSGKPDNGISDALTGVSDLVLTSDFAEAAKVIDSLIKKYDLRKGTP